MTRWLLALVAALALLIWHQQTRIDAAQSGKELAVKRAEQAEQTAAQHQANADTLAATLATERTAQAQLQTRTTELRTLLAARQRDIEELKRENEDLRRWADQPLPAAARRLRERPALTGADAYRDWLSRRDAVRAASDGAGQ
ncbi:peptidase [Pseudomonas flexibilis]|uniref:Peptidase n=1 Tax=Pseudomonas flexibilis TaxID=706570 RepID=A0A0B3C020_9PSED|nr:peptidase [Pseudomonas flexibilis]SCY30968.1 phage lysis regulatory protein, LysB family [Pseudomonas flexibilis]